MREPLKVGDRVRVYGHVARNGKPLVGHIHEKPVDVSEKFRGDNYVLIYDEEYPDSGYYAHPKQCRRLVKKERRRVWVERGSFRGDTYEIGNGRYQPVVSLKPVPEWVEFIEVRHAKR